MNDAERRELSRQIEESRRQHEADECQQHEARAKELAVMWENLPTSGNSPIS